jgi:hypothetical protein
MPDFGIFRGFNDKLFGDKLYAGQLPINLGLIGSEDISLLLLDDYPNAAAAYSLRKLRSAYTGSAIEVRNDSGVHLDIGFVDVELDTETLLTHCGSGNGTVSKWYDQSGNARNATQATAINQPQIVSSGSVILENGKPALDFDRFQRCDVPSISINFDNLSIIGVLKSDNSGTNGFAFANPDPDRLYMGYTAGGILYFGYDDSAVKFNLGTATTNEQLIELYAGTNANAYINTIASTQITSATTSITTTDLSIGSYIRNPVINNYYDGRIKEIILYTSDQSSNRTGIENNINDFYSIY